MKKGQAQNVPLIDGAVEVGRAFVSFSFLRVLLFLPTFRQTGTLSLPQFSLSSPLGLGSELLKLHSEFPVLRISPEILSLYCLSQGAEKRNE